MSKMRGNETSTLRELAQLIPSTLSADSKKPTKKEILLRVLCYIEHLQRNIHAARALLQPKQRGNKDRRRGERRGEKAPCFNKSRILELEFTPHKKGHEISPPCTPPRIKRTRQLGVCKKPRKDRRPQKAECREVLKKPRRCFCEEKISQNERRNSVDLCLQGNVPGNSTVALPPATRIASVLFDARCSGAAFHECPPESYMPPRFAVLDCSLKPEMTLAFTLPETIVEPGTSNFMERHVSSGITLLEMAGTDTFFCSTERFQNRSLEEDVRVAFDEEGSRLLLLRHEAAEPQALVCYHSSSEEEPDTSPWLPPHSPMFGSRAVTLYCSPGNRGWSSSCWLSRDLGLSPSLFTSPGRLLPGQTLQDGTENLSQVLFEDVRLSPQSPRTFLLQNLSGSHKIEVSDHITPETPRSSLDLFQSSFSLDHCYLSVSEASRTDSSPSSSVTELVSAWNSQVVQEVEVPNSSQDNFRASSDENGDFTWTPCKKKKPSYLGGRKRKQGHSFQRLKALKKHHCAFQLKKKCVNGFIMFCRMNRKQYIRICPGTASTTATKELAHLWRVMSKQERRPYCIKARRFSRQHNRIMKQRCASSDEEDDVTPKPLHLLLAEKAMYSPDVLPSRSSLPRHQHRSPLRSSLHMS